MCSTGREGKPNRERGLHPEALDPTHKRHVLIGFQKFKPCRRTKFWHLDRQQKQRGRLDPQTYAAQSPEAWRGPRPGGRGGGVLPTLAPALHTFTRDTQWTDRKRRAGRGTWRTHVILIHPRGTRSANSWIHTKTRTWQRWDQNVRAPCS